MVVHVITAPYDSNHDPPSFNNDKRRIDDNYNSFGCVTKTTPSHTINHGSVLYLALLQILL